MDFGFTTAAYVVAAVLFILSLGGLSGQESAKRAVWYGITGMALAVFATLIGPGSGLWFLSLVLIGAGGVIGYMLASKVEMTQMPELVAIMHSLVGLAAVLVGWAAYLNPGAFGLLVGDSIGAVSKIEMGLGIAIGAITFSGSVIAFAKLSGRMSGSPILLPARHVINLGTLLAIIVLTGLFALAGPKETLPLIIALTVLAFLIGFLLIIPIGGADMPVVVSMLNSYSGWAAAAAGFLLENNLLIVTGALVGSSGAILSYIMCRAMNRSFISVIAGGFGNDPIASDDEEEGEARAASVASDNLLALEIERKQQVPNRLHPELWFNEYKKV